MSRFPVTTNTQKERNRKETSKKGKTKTKDIKKDRMIIFIFISASITSYSGFEHCSTELKSFLRFMTPNLVPTNMVIN